MLLRISSHVPTIKKLLQCCQFFILEDFDALKCRFLCMMCVNTHLHILVRCVLIRTRLTRNQSSPQMVTAPPTQTDGNNVLTFLEDLTPLLMSSACRDRAMITITGRQMCVGTLQGTTEDCWLGRRDGCGVWSSVMKSIQHGMHGCPISCLLHHIIIGLVFYVRNSPQGC